MFFCQVSPVPFWFQNIKPVLSMENITNISFGPLPENSSGCKPFRLYFHQNGVEKNWDLIKTEGSVTVLIYNKTSNKLVMIKQFRPAVYYAVISNLGYKYNETVDLVKYPVRLGTTVELCGGFADQKLQLKEVAKGTILEQGGFNVSLESLEEVINYRSGVGTIGGSQTMFYCEVTNEDKVVKDDGDKDNIIEVVEVSMQEAQAMVTQGANNHSSPNCLFGVLWFLRNKAPSK